MDEKRCPRCKETKPVSEFGKDRRNKDGYNLYCRACKKKYNDEQREYRTKYYHLYHKQHRAEEQEYSKQYRKEHRENCRKICANYRAKCLSADGNITKQEMDSCLEFFKYECAYSGVPLSAGYHLDHVNPLSRGGSNDIHNIVPCLQVINLQKGAKSLEAWYPEQSFYSEERYNRIKEWTKKREE